MIKLSAEEKRILDGDFGPERKKILESLIIFSDFYGAKDFINITGPGHLALGFGTKGFEVVSNIFDSLISQNLKTKYPFTISSWLYSYLESTETWSKIFHRKRSVKSHQEVLEKKLISLGLNPDFRYLDAISLAKSDTVQYGDVLCWSDSALITFANSALGARVNSCGPVIDLFCNILGKVPNYGLVTKEGRKANVIIKIETATLPDAGLLGVAVAQKAKDQIPYIYGLEKLLKAKYDEKTLAFLKDFSAGFSSEGALRIFHINGITPDAKKLKKELINPQAQTISINEQEIERVKENFELFWKNLDAKPSLCFIGQPDLSLYQLVYWTNEIGWELKQNKRKKLKIKTVFLTNKEVLKAFKQLPEYKELKSYGAVIKTMSPFNNIVASKKVKKKIITNSNEIRSHANVKFCKEDEILKIITGRK